MAEYSIGIDIGGTKIAIGIVRRDGHILDYEVHPTPKTSREDIIELLGKSLLSFERKARKQQIPLRGIGIGTAGQINSKEGVIISGTDNIKDWNNVPLKQHLSQSTSLPIFVDNDANTFALAEYYLGHGKGVKDMIALTLGTGVGGGVISAGKLLRGHWGGAAELGHMTVQMNGPLCNCGSRGCLEMYTSGTGIANRMKEQIIEEQGEISPQIAMYKGEAENITSKQVFEWYEEGIPEAVSVLDDAIKALTFGSISLIHTFNPALLVFGGGLVEYHPWLLDRVREKVHVHGIASLVKEVDIVQSHLGYNTGLIGASLLPWTNQ